MKHNHLTRLLAMMLALLLCVSAVDSGIVCAFAEETEEELTEQLPVDVIEEPEEILEAEEELTEESEEAEEEEPIEEPVEELAEDEPEDEELWEEVGYSGEFDGEMLTVSVTYGQIRKIDLVRAIRKAYGPATTTRYYISTNPNATAGELKTFANLLSEKISLTPGLYYAYTKNLLTNKVKLAGPFTVVESVILPEPEIILKETIGSVSIPYSGDGAVNTALLARILFEAMYDSSTPELTVDDVVFSFNDGESFQPLDAVTAGTHCVKMTFPGNKDYAEGSACADVTFVEPTKSKIVLKENMSIPYNADVDVMRKAIFDNVIDWSVSALPKGTTIDDLIFEYKPSVELLKRLGLDITTIWWYDVEGFGTIPQIFAGSHEVRVREKGLLSYLGTEGTMLEVEKAKISVKVKSASIYANEPLPDNLVTITPNDSEIKTVTVFTGATNDVSLGVYVDLPVKVLADSELTKLLDPLVKRVTGVSFIDLVKRGITVGELRALVNLDEVMDILDKLGYDSSIPRLVLNLLDSLSGLTDNIRISLNSPNRAGLYNVTCFAGSKNYATTVGMGTLTVKVVTSGVELVWDEEFPKVITVSELADFTYGATVMVNGQKAPFQDNISIKFTGITSKLRLYSSSKMPTEPGSYVVTVKTSGGSYKANALTQSFRIVQD